MVAHSRPDGTRRITHLRGFWLAFLAVASRGTGSVLQFALTVYIGRTFLMDDAGVYFVIIGWAYMIAAAASSSTSDCANVRIMMPFT